jgi:hypothetical protein
MKTSVTWASLNSVNPGVIITELQKRGGLDEEKYRNFLEHSKVEEVNTVKRPYFDTLFSEKSVFL